MYSSKYFVMLLVFIGFLSGCGQSSVFLDFKQSDYPKTLADVSGVSAREDWGRWTDGPVVKLRFNESLPRNFTLQINAGAFGPNLDKPIIIRAGNVNREFTISSKSTSFLNSAQFTISFEGVDGADTIEIVPPQPTRPKDIGAGSDARSLGLALISIQMN